LTGPVLEPDFISRLKHKYLTGSGGVPIEIKSLHTSSVQAASNQTVKNSKINIQLVIDDILEEPTDILKYQLTSINPNISDEFILGIIHLETGEIIASKLGLTYDSNSKQYSLAVSANQDYTPGRILIVTSFQLTAENYQENEVNLKSIDLSTPGVGCGSRPGMNTQRTEDKQLLNLL
jgi:hypothetical protein